MIDDTEDYEQVRADKMARNNVILSGLGFQPMAIAPTTKKKNLRKTGEVRATSDGFSPTVARRMDLNRFFNFQK